MKNPFHLAQGHNAGTPDGNANQHIASGINADVPVPMTQPVDEPAAILWLQQQAQFVARFLCPSFREG